MRRPFGGAAASTPVSGLSGLSGLSGGMLAMVVAVGSGCSVAPPPGTPILDAHRPDGTGGADEATLIAASYAPGVILRFEPGDLLEVELALTGDLVTGTATMPVIVQHAILVHLGPDGPVGSLDDGTTWAPLRDLVTGSLDLGASVSGSDAVNAARIGLDARIDRHRKR